MALREIRLIGDEMLTKPCREVKEITPRIAELIEDLLETMYDADGLGLAAPQVGVLRRVVVIDIWQPDIEDEDEEEPGEDAAEEKQSGEDAEETKAEAEEPQSGGDAAEAGEKEPQSGEESAESGDEEEEDKGPLIMVNPVITRKEGEQTGDEGCLSLPGKVGKVTRPQSVTVTYFDENMEEYELEAEGLLARAICHEVDHLDGHTYVEFVEGEIRDAGHPEEEDEEGEPDGEEAGDTGEDS